MRLTLRTLLAYRDGVLPSGVADEMHRRIQASEDASNLLNRIQSISGQVIGASPTIVGKGLSGDPNFLAEYLDDVLPREQVPELERICLQSNIHLSELASCHALLSTAIHTRVKVPEELRNLASRVGKTSDREVVRNELNQRKQQRHIGSRQVHVDQAHVGFAKSVDPKAEAADANLSPVGDVAKLTTTEPRTDAKDANRVLDPALVVQVRAPMGAAGGEAVKQQGLNLEGSALTKEVPEYLVGAKSGNWKIPLAIVGLLLLLGVLVWQALGPWDRMRDLFAQNSNPGTMGAPTGTPAADASSAGSQALDYEPDVGEPDVATNAESPEKALAPTMAMPSDNAKSPSVSPDNVLSSNSPSARGEIDSAPAASPNTASPDAANPGAPASVPDADKNIPSGNDVPDAQPKPVVTLRGVVGQHSAVSFVRGSNSDWKLLSPGVDVDSGSTVIVPPHFRSQFDLPGGLLWESRGPSQLIVSSDGIETNLCRALLTKGPAAKPGAGSAVRLVCPAGTLLVTLSDEASKVALETGFRHDGHGSVLDKGHFRSTTTVVAVEGSVSVKLIGAPEKAVSLNIGEGIAWVEGEKPKEFGMRTIPSWYREHSRRPIDVEAALEFSTDLISALADGEDLPTVVSRLAKSRRAEEAALATQAAIQLGDWAPFASDTVLNSSSMSIHWDAILDFARQQLAARPNEVDVVREMFKDYRPDGDTLFANLCGLTADQIRGDGVAELVAQLANDDMASRILAFYELKKLTGKKLGFKPNDPNRASLMSWRRELAIKRLAVEARRDIIWERTAAN